jgi:lipopolysaccharide export LptBFGC system permease protein LptF
MIGAAVGIVFFLGGQLFNQFGAALNLPAAVTALLPAVLLMTVGLSLLERVR